MIKKGKTGVIYALVIPKNTMTGGDRLLRYRIMAAVGANDPHVLEERETLARTLDPTDAKMRFNPGDKVIVTLIVTQRKEIGTINWVTDEECGVTYDSGGSSVIPLLPHADNFGAWTMTLDKGIRSNYIKSRGNRQ